jgi:hypothetical protein
MTFERLCLCVYVRARSLASTLRRICSCLHPQFCYYRCPWGTWEQMLSAMWSISLPDVTVTVFRLFITSEISLRMRIIRRFSSLGPCRCCWVLSVPAFIAVLSLHQQYSHPSPKRTSFTFTLLSPPFFCCCNFSCLVSLLSTQLFPLCISLVHYFVDFLYNFCSFIYFIPVYLFLHPFRRGGPR